MRPRGEERQALLQAAKRLAKLRQQAPLEGTRGEALIGATWLELMQFANVGRDATVNTLKNMVRSDELEIVGCVRADHSDRPLAVYAPKAATAPSWLTLHDAMTTWAAVR